MGEQKEEDLYRNFSRKDLQGLCKKYGLPANKSNSEMATSLILFLEKKNLSSRGIWEGISGDSFALGTTDLPAGVRMNLADDKRKDCGRMASHSGSGNNQRHNHRVAKVNDMQQCEGFASSNKGSEDVGVVTQLYRESNSGIAIPENTFSSVVSSSVVAPSPTFKFDVCCEDGIQLFVDLDSSPSDWIESLKAGVHICHDLDKPKSQSFHEDIGFLSSSKQKNGSVVMDPSNEADKGQLKDGSYPTTILSDVQAQTSEADRGNTFLPSPGLKSFTNASHSSENIKELQAVLSSRIESGTVGQLPSASSRSDETLVTDLDVDAAVQTGTNNLSGNSLPSDPKCSGMLAHHGASAGDGMDIKPPLQQSYSSLEPVLKYSESSTAVCLEMQASTCATMDKDVESFPLRVGKCVDLAEQSKDAKMVQCGTVKSVQNTPSKNELFSWPVEAVDQSKGVSCSPMLNSFSLDLADNKGKVDAEHGKASSSRKSDRNIKAAQTHSTENARKLMEHEVVRENDEACKKDAALHPCCSNRPIDLVVSEQNGEDHHMSTKINESKEDICRSPSTANVEPLGNSNIGNGMEGSECLKFDNLMEKPRKRPADSEANTELKRKRHFISLEGQNNFVNDEAKILRSSKQFSEDAHSKRRRSSRLFTK